MIGVGTSVHDGEWGGGERKRVRQREKERSRREITDTQYKTCGGETVPCRRTPPFFLKRGLPDHNGGLERKEEGMEGVREKEKVRTGQSFDHVAAANQLSVLHHEADSKAGI